MKLGEKDTQEQKRRQSAEMADSHRHLWPSLIYESIAVLVLPVLLLLRQLSLYLSTLLINLHHLPGAQTETDTKRGDEALAITSVVSSSSAVPASANLTAGLAVSTGSTT